MSTEALQTAFERWWVDEVIPKFPDWDIGSAQKVKALCRVAWSNGAYTQERVDECIIRMKMKHTSYTCNIDQKPPKK